MNIIDHVTLVAANDYTKNISELVFSPAVYARPQTTIGGRKMPVKASRYREIEGELKNERERRSKLAEDVKRIRAQLDTIQQSVNSGSSKK